jgi:hypothetical protein
MGFAADMRDLLAYGTIRTQRAKLLSVVYGARQYCEKNVTSLSAMSAIALTLGVPALAGTTTKMNG